MKQSRSTARSGITCRLFPPRQKSRSRISDPSIAQARYRIPPGALQFGPPAVQSLRQRLAPSRSRDYPRDRAIPMKVLAMLVGRRRADIALLTSPKVCEQPNAGGQDPSCRALKQQPQAAYNPFHRLHDITLLPSPELTETGADRFGPGVIWMRWRVPLLS